MPIERRDKNSGALIFVPTQSEEVHIASLRRLKDELAEVQELKKELKKLIEEQKKGMN